jgi:hypothetical protein
MLIKKFARGATFLALLLGTRYGSAGLKIKLLAMGVAGGNEKTDHFVLSVSAAAIVLRRVVIAGISPP